MYVDYDKRFAEARRHLRELDEVLVMLKRRYRALALTRKTAIESHQGYVDTLARLRLQIKTAQGKVRPLFDHQGKVIEIMAVNELAKRRERLEEFRVKARFAMADSYDRARKAQTPQQDRQ